MAKLIILSQPEPHSDGFISLACDVTARSDDDRELPGFHRTVIIPPENLIALVEQPDLKAAMQYVAEQIAAVDPTFDPKRLAQAEYALYALDVINAAVQGYPVEIPINTPTQKAITEPLLEASARMQRLES